MSTENDSTITVGRLRELIDEADLDDDTPVIVMQDRSAIQFDEDDGEREPVHATASKGYGERSVLRIHLAGS